jgi:hypothetical protein
MRVLLVAASTHGYRSPDANAARTAALRRAIERAPSSTELVIIPAGYWTAPRDSAVSDVLASLASELAPLLAPRSLALLAGIDALPAPTQLPSTIRRGALPFWGFALDGADVCGPWRQISTTRPTSTLAPPAAIDDIIDRVLEVGGRRILPLLCGEMHSRLIRDRAASTETDLVAVLGHAGLGQGLVPTLASIHAATATPVLHTQHLAPHSHGSHHWIDSRGAPRHAPPTADRAAFWLSSRSIAV